MNAWERLWDLFLAWILTLYAINIIREYGWESNWLMAAVFFLVLAFANACRAVQPNTDKGRD